MVDTSEYSPKKISLLRENLLGSPLLVQPSIYEY